MKRLDHAGPQVLPLLLQVGGGASRTVFAAITVAPALMSKYLNWARCLQVVGQEPERGMSGSISRDARNLRQVRSMNTGWSACHCRVRRVTRG